VFVFGLETNTVLGLPAAQSTPVGCAEAKNSNESPLRAVISHRTPSGGQCLMKTLLTIIKYALLFIIYNIYTMTLTYYNKS